MLKFVLNISLGLDVLKCEHIAFLILDQELQIQKLVSRLLG